MGDENGSSELTARVIGVQRRVGARRSNFVIASMIWRALLYRLFIPKDLFSTRRSIPQPADCGDEIGDDIHVLELSFNGWLP